MSKRNPQLYDFLSEEDVFESKRLASASWKLMPILFLPPLPLGCGKSFTADNR